MRRFTIVIFAIMLAGCSASATPVLKASSTAPPEASASAKSAPAVGLTDAQKTTQMKRNVAVFVGADWYPVLHLLTGAPDVVVSGGVATVATTLPQTDMTTGATICHAVAVVLTDDNGQPLGISGVVGTSGGQKIVDCQPL